ncbi:MAG: alanine racemase [Gemmatimonadales bacterium]
MTSWRWSGRNPGSRSRVDGDGAPFTEDVAIQRAAFGRLRRLKERLEGQGVPVAQLSMGMSGDFEAAVEEGATMVQLGTILFGERER